MGSRTVPWPAPIRVKASDLMRDTTMTVELEVVHDWRFCLGLWLMKLGVRVMRSRLDIRESDAPAAG